MVVLTPIEREALQVFLHISQMLSVSTFGNLRIETRWSDFKCFNVKILYMCISWCAN